MAVDIFVRQTIPIFPDHAVLLFGRWMPLREEDVVTVTLDNLTTRLWFDLSCSTLRDVDLPDIDMHTWVIVTKVHAETALGGVPDKLVDFIYEECERYKLGPNDSHDARYKQLRDEYQEMGRKVLQTSLAAFNRLIRFARNQKGQYWLDERPIDFDHMASDFVEFRAKVKLPDRDWIAWYPGSTDLIRLRGPSPEKLITDADWADARLFVCGNNRIDLILELLANSEALAANGYRRNAIIEAVTALEIAVSRFAHSPKLNELVSSEIARRMDTVSLRSQVEHLGFSASIRFLLPLLFGEELLPCAVINQCQRAVAIRGNVVHEGQRDIEESTIWPLLQGIRAACAILMRYTRGRPARSSADRDESEEAAVE